MSKQATLFQSWGSKSQKTRSSQDAGPSRVDRSKAGTGTAAVSREQFVDLCGDEDDEDILLAMAMEESLKELEAQGSTSVTSSDSKPIGKATSSTSIATTSKKPSALFSCVRSTKSSTAPAPPPISDDWSDIPEGDEAELEVPDVSDVEDLPGFDKYAGRTWIYPTNYPVRAYQYDIVQQALLKNTMVVLPTGLGKTFIAAVVMYNFYRWYPQGKVIFMAPTKPLVAQQIEACYNIMGIPQVDTAEMTGAMQPTERRRCWAARRLFFLTPQVLTNDLSRSAFPAELVKCVVIDEAHKALGNHAYCQVVRELVKHSPDFRVLALSATPGSDIKAVQDVLNNLLIAHVELRSEDSKDIQPYTHERVVDKIVVPLGAELVKAREQYLQVVSVLVSRLQRHGVLFTRDPKTLSKFLILKARDAFRQNPPQRLQRAQFGAIEGDFALCMSLYHGYEVLQVHGLRSLYNFLDGIMKGDKTHGRARTELQKNQDFMGLFGELGQKFDAVKSLDPNASFRSQPAADAPTLAIGHPKMSKLEEVVLEHFRKFEQANDATRIMIFSQYRDSVNEITEVLNRHRPLVKVMSFVGQSSVGKTSRGFTQKEQLKVMARFRDGGYNTLVSTCVGEEGLDIGDVDLIVCFDAHKSPIRLVQRMGRTGRKRQGRIVMLVTEGKEEQIYNQSQYSKNKIHKAILNGTRTLIYYPHNPRMVPAGLTPVCHKMHISVKEKYQPRGKQKADSKVKVTAASDRKPGKAGPVSKDAKDGFLSAAELQYWSDHYKVDEEEVPALPPSTFCTLKPQDDTNPATTPHPGPALSLSDWLPWQNVLQPVHMVDHSDTTRDMVHLMEFMELQAATGTQEDNYSLEMEMCLNTDDILKPGQKNVVAAGNHGILKFCSSDKANEPKRKKKPPAVVPSDSEDDDFCLADPPGRHSDDSSPHGNRPPSDSSPHGNRNRPNTTPRAHGEGVRPRPRRSDLLPQFDDDEVTMVSDDDELPVGLNTSHQPNVLEEKSTAIIDNKPSSTPRTTKGKSGGRNKAKNKTPEVADDKTKRKGGFQSILKAFQYQEKPAEKPSEKPPTIPAQPTEERSDVDVEIMRKISPKSARRKQSDTEVPCPTSPPRMDTEVSLADLLPIFSPNKDTNSRPISRNKRVKTPPKMEEISEAFAALDKHGKILPVDFLDLVDDWGRTCSARPSDTGLCQTGDELGDGDTRTSQEDTASVMPLLKHSAHLASSDAGRQSMPKTSMSKSTVILNPVVKEEKRTSKSNSESVSSFHMDDVACDSVTKVTKEEEEDSKSSDVTVDPMETDFNMEGSGSDDKSSESSKYLRNPHCKKNNQSDSPFSLTNEHDEQSSEDFHLAMEDFADPFTMEAATCDSNKDNETDSQPGNIEDTNKSVVQHTVSACNKSPFGQPPSKTSTPALPLKTRPTTVVCETPLVDAPGPRSSLRAAHQSFFAEEDDDSLFSAISFTEPRKAKPAEGSQVTFTQAMDCVSDNFEPTQRTDRRSTSGHGDSTTDSVVFPGRPSAAAAAAPLEPPPQFDLGFDLEDFDEELVPPSPECVVRPMSSQRVSVSMVSGSEVSGGESRLLGDSRDCDGLDRQPHAENRRSVGEKSPTKPPAVTTVAAPRPVAVVMPTCPSDPCDPDTAPKPDWDPDGETLDMEAYHPQDELSDDEDESIIGAPRRRKAQAILGSPDSPQAQQVCSRVQQSEFKTPLKPAPRGKRPRISSEEDSPLHRPAAKRKIPRIADPDDEDDDEDFAVPSRFHKKTESSKVKNQNKSGDQKKKSSRRRGRRECDFIEDEAALDSGDEQSSDEDDSDMDVYDLSFVNDMTQASQQDQVDMRAVYMQSVRSPLVGGPSRKMTYRSHVPDVEVFSQIPQQDSEYLEDSFCVGDNMHDSEMPEGFEDTYNEVEDSMMLEIMQKNSKKSKSKAAGSKRRVVRLAESSSEDEVRCSPDKTSCRPARIESPAVTVPTANKPARDNNSPGGDEFTQIQSLRSRIQSKLRKLTHDREQSSSSVSHPTLNTKCSPPRGTVDEPTFSLGLGDEFDDIEEDDGIFGVVEPAENSRRPFQPAASKPSPTSTVIRGASVISPPGGQLQSREERLRISRLKQEEFRKKQQQKLQNASSSSNHDSSTRQLQTSTLSMSKSTINSSSVADNRHSTTATTGSSSFTKLKDKLVVIVSSRELSSAQDLVSGLRFQHGLSVVVKSVGHCDYILSNRMAVERKFLSDFTNGSQRSQLVERLRLLCELFDCPCLLVERDRVRVGEEKAAAAKTLLRSKYVDHLVASLGQTHIKLLFSQSQEESAELLAELATQEHRKQQAIAGPTELSSQQEQVLQFYLSLPKISYVAALNLLHKFRTVQDFIRSPVRVLERRGGLNKSKAQEVYNFLRHEFDGQMLGAGRC